MNVVKLPVSGLLDIPAGLRKLADDIEKGGYGDTHNLAWVIDEGDGVISVGLLGQSASPGADTHILLAIAQRHLEDV